MNDEHSRGPQQGAHDGTSDPWTQNDAVTPPPADAGHSGDDAETLRERQRLQQMDMMDRWIGGVLAEQRRSRRWKIGLRLLIAALLLASVSLSAYSLFGEGPSTAVSTQPHLGLIKVDGAIASDSPANAERIIRGLNRAWKAENTRAVVLHINSPGGSPVQSQRVYAEVMRLRDAGDKPVLAVVEDIGASGAYYIASAADEVIAAPSSLVGSIGVIYSGFGFQQTMDKLGVERRVVTAGDNKAFLDPFQPMDESVRDFWKDVLGVTHQQFIDDVQAGRGERLRDDPRIFSGLIWSGEQALELGLVDRLATIEQVSREYTDSVRWQDYTPSLSPLDRLARQFGQVAAGALGLSASSSPVRFEVGR